ncbi:MAG TPA: hypothetical protein VH328_01830, partial [Burkholderiaceae bacterium]|nr:hypothetical protein [Burkholderiaceae bacterium]
MPRPALAWRVLQVAAGLGLFVFALMTIEPLPLSRLCFVAVAALLMAGSMAVADSLVGLLAALVVKLQQGRRACA